MPTAQSLRVMILVLLYGAAATAAKAATVSGSVFYERASGLTAAPSATHVKLCPGPGGTGTCSSTTTSGSAYSLTILPGTYYVFMWNDTDLWGSTTAPSYVTPGHSAQCSVGSGGAVCSIAGQPRPFDSFAAFPSNGEEHAPLYLNLKWRVATDVERSAHPATFDIWGHGLNGTDLLQFENIPCNPDEMGFCQARIPYALVGNTLYYWHVVTKLYTGNYSNYYSPYNYFTTDARFVAAFITTVDPNAGYSFQSQSDGTFLSAQYGSSCGGGAMTHGAYGVGQCEAFFLLDDNGGDINSGDVIHLSSGSYWASAELGGGDPFSYVNVNRTWVQSWETFTIEKPGGGRIINGDTISIRSVNGYYMTSEPDGSVTCNRPAIGLWEQYWIGGH